MDPNPPLAFIGYAWDKSDGFVIKVCPDCPNPNKVKDWVKPMKTRDKLCLAHYNIQLAKRMGETL